jgi:cyanophycinase
MMPIEPDRAPLECDLVMKGGVTSGVIYPGAIAAIAATYRLRAIGGTSAGASIQSSHMLAFGVGGSTPKQRMTQMAAGLGLLQGTVIDQHFEQRNRYGRLLMIVSQSPQLLGMGVDEDTAAIVHDGVLSVVGRGAVTILDPSAITTNAFDARRSAPLLASGVVLHVLPQGARFDLATRTLLPWQVPVDPLEATEMEEAGKDLRQMARDIAAGDASPGVLRRRLTRTRKKSVPPTDDGDPS